MLFNNLIFYLDPLDPTELTIYEFLLKTLLIITGLNNIPNNFRMFLLNFISIKYYVNMHKFSIVSSYNDFQLYHAQISLRK
jgi:hypothetical protein